MFPFSRKDYGVAPMSTLLDTVKVMQFAVSVGKVAVHCHAGLGRTGLIIACYLIYNNRVGARKAIQYVRSRRPGSIQTKQQVATCLEFEQYLQVYFIVFTTKIPNAHPVSFSLFLVRQRQLLHGYEARKLKHIPKVVYVCCERLLELCGKGTALSSLRETPVDPLPADFVSLQDGVSPRPAPNFTDQQSRKPLLGTLTLDIPGQGGPKKILTKPRVGSLIGKESGMKESLSSSTINDLKSIDQKGLGLSPPALSRSLRSLDVSPLSRTKHGSLRNHLADSDRAIVKNAGKIKNYRGKSTNGKDTHSADEDENDSYDEEIDGESIVRVQTDEEFEQAKLQAAREVEKAEEAEVKIHAQRSSLSNIFQPVLAFMTPQEVCEAAIAVENSEDVCEFIETYKDKLNQSHQGWQALAMEENPAVICGLMSSWLDHLNEPVLRFQDINSIISNESNIERAFRGLETSTRYFLEYILIVLSKFDPVNPWSLNALLEIMLTNLCQKRLQLGHVTWPSSGHQSVRSEARPDYAEALFQLFLNLVALERKKIL
ncbi:tyrosine phosphatase domain-containing protein 1 [Plakobranchus ocellatus]|uniref:Tyrosine phosphatase domain-containing protein 1 n=1 Tax=Plakobranchus ocellatus TaxID=259542 RepID=A0AAV4DI86_9GAST|nr:tyrosine phosphatase domain-containing protein 1 [Plakobranchus ocellatus]